MPRKHYRAQPSEQHPLTTETRLPTHRPIAIYYRQSTEEQIGNISTTVQTVDMVRYLQQQGWTDDNIIMIDMDAGISGTTKIDERPGMKKLYSLINQDKIGAVACQDEDRLFRDVTQIQVNIFIEACKVHRVLVMTPTMVYNFAHEQLGTFHARQFRFRSEIAADYIDTVVKGKLLSAKRSLLIRGKWAGSPLPVGFMVDVRKYLPDSTRNENWRQFEIFEPYAEIVREYFKIFLSYSGCLRHTLSHIKQHGPFFPNPATCPPPEGYRIIYRIRPNVNGWCLKSAPALGQMLTHAAYIGHWVVNGSVIKWNNHPSIVDEATFYRAFNYLSPVDFAGKKNPDYKPYRRNVRPTKEANRNVDRPLCAGMISSFWEGKPKAVGTRWITQHNCYDYIFAANDGYGATIWSKRATYIDLTVSTLLLDKLSLTFDYDVWESAADASLEDFEIQRKLKESQLQQLKIVMENLVISLSSLSLPQMITAVEQKYQAAQEEYERLQNQLNIVISDEAKMQKIKEIKNNFGDVLARWDQMTSHEKREVIHAFVNRLEVTQAEDKMLFLTIFWKDGTTDSVHLEHAISNGFQWLPQDVELLIKLVESGADKVKIAKAFPDTTWKHITKKYRYITKKPLGAYKRGPMRRFETYNEYATRVGINGQQNTSSEVGSAGAFASNAVRCDKARAARSADC